MLKPGDIVKRQGADETGVVLSVVDEDAVVAWADDIDNAIDGWADNIPDKMSGYYDDGRRVFQLVAMEHPIAELVRA